MAGTRVPKRLRSSGEAVTEDLGAKIARLALERKAPRILCLFGALGSGKTCFVRGFARGAGYKGSVASPTFSLVREYRGPKANIYHLDLFRIGGKDIPNLGLEDYLADEKGICVIEWPETVLGLLPKPRLEIRFAHVSRGGRMISVKGL